MAYDSKSDKLIKLYEYKEDKNTLLISIFSYNGNEPKLQMHRMFESDSGIAKHGKVGRMTLKETQYLKENIDEIIDIMKG